MLRFAAFLFTCLTYFAGSPVLAQLNTVPCDGLSVRVSGAVDGMECASGRPSGSSGGIVAKFEQIVGSMADGGFLVYLRHGRHNTYFYGITSKDWSESITGAVNIQEEQRIAGGYRYRIFERNGAQCIGWLRGYIPIENGFRKILTGAHCGAPEYTTTVVSSIVKAFSVR